MVNAGKRAQAAPPLLCKLCALCVEIPVPTLRIASQESRALSLIPGTLADHPQLVENAMPLSPAFATLTGNVNSKPFVCHSYKKTGGRGLRNRPPCAIPRPYIGCSFDRSVGIVTLRTHSNSRNSSRFMRLLHGSLDTRGGVLPSPSPAWPKPAVWDRVRSRLPLRQKPARTIQVLPLLPFHLGNGLTRMEA
jgi:hypothetical protein